MILVAVWLAVLLSAFPTAGQDAAPTLPQPSNTGVLVLNAQPGGDEATKRLEVNVHRDGGAQAMTGTVDVAGFPQIDGGQWGDVDWNVNGSQVTGTVRNRDGSVVGTFAGTVTATGMSGTVTHADGRTGLWSWAGPPPAAVANEE